MTAIVAPILVVLLRKYKDIMVNIIATMVVASSLYAAKVSYDNKFIIKSFDMYAIARVVSEQTHMNEIF